MTFRYLLAATLLAGGVLAAGTAARADTTIDFTGYDSTTTSQVDVSGSFSYDPSTLGGATTIGYANLTAFSIDFPMYPNHNWGVGFVQPPQDNSHFSFNISNDTLANPLFESYTDASTEGFEIFVTSGFVSTAIDGESTDDATIGSLTFTPAGSAAVPEPPAAAVLGLALFGLMLVRGRGGWLTGA